VLNRWDPAASRRGCGTRRPWFMIKSTGFLDRNPTLEVPAPGGRCHAEA
jgi:hypothetical protein